MIYVVCVAAGAGLGLLFRWWGLAGAIGFGAWIGLATDVDAVPRWLLGSGYGLAIAIGVFLGVMVRRVFNPSGSVVPPPP